MSSKHCSSKPSAGHGCADLFHGVVFGTPAHSKPPPPHHPHYVTTRISTSLQPHFLPSPIFVIRSPPGKLIVMSYPPPPGGAPPPTAYPSYPGYPPPAGSPQPGYPGAPAPAPGYGTY